MKVPSRQVSTAPRFAHLTFTQVQYSQRTIRNPLTQHLNNMDSSVVLRGYVVMYIILKSRSQLLNERAESSIRIYKSGVCSLLNYASNARQ